jgi:CheY-like chemotaxis protein
VHVLVVDDNLLSRTRIAGHVQEAGWTVTVSAPDPSALARLQDNLPDAVVVNLAAGQPMPWSAASGDDRSTTFVRMLRATPPWARVPVLGFCGHTDRRRRDAGLAAGCTKVETNASVASKLAELIQALAAAGSVQGGN